MQAILALSLTTALSVTPTTDRDTIVETAVAAGAFETLATALTKAELIDALSGEGPFTVFAPTDDAFAALPDGTVASLLKKKNRAQLTSILTYHVVPGRLTSADLAGRSRAETLVGQALDVEPSGSTLSIDGATVVKADIECSNGIIHVIDRVLMPTNKDLVQTASDAGSFGTLLAAAKSAGLVDVLKGDGPLTVLAPTDEAFAALGDAKIQELLRPENQPILASILTYHVIPGRLFADQAVAARQADSVQGASVRFGIERGRLQAQGANVLATDLECSNGVIHVIDAVLLPPAESLPKARARGRKVIGVYSEAPGKALASQLGLDTHKTLLVTDLTKDGNAARDGLQKYDVILLIDGEPATDERLAESKEKAGFGGTVALTILRGGAQQLVRVEVGESH